MLIGELAAMTATTTKTLRFYEQQGLLPAPERTTAGYRDYPPEMAERVAFIRGAQACGLTLAHIGEILTIRDRGQPPCTHVLDLVGQRLAQVEAALVALEHTRRELESLGARTRRLDPSDCTPGDICSAIDSAREDVPGT